MRPLTPWAALLRTYYYGYTAAHDFAVSDRIMVDDYVLYMGPDEIRGRTQAYQPATQRQYEQFPGLGFTVHQFVANGDRAALHFSEHGRSARTGTCATWQGVSLYRWNGRQLVECRVEQDYHSRHEQLSARRPLPVMTPAHDPWFCDDVPASAGVERAVSDWLTSNAWIEDRAVAMDDESGRLRWEDPQTTVLDVFGAGTFVAFHARLNGLFRGGPGKDAQLLVGASGDMYATGLVNVDQLENIVGGTVITDRRSCLRRLRPAGQQL